ncbi:hypothetical protein LL033_11850 [Clostridium estertheticum]|uniref:hypothetical protein n=1 Tax=Clostridium estertheticum TaxID=238834 RepID=UPI001C0B59C0|nr:hypothetical protein [Clostridium estertheticum]MBU3215845.1 hypothetical protein [Clostridium estertheticum]WAG57800.1 hypothetical protein LL033_11850 [Clostridium estertheticum]
MEKDINGKGIQGGGRKWVNKTCYMIGISTLAWDLRAKKQTFYKGTDKTIK